MACYVSGDKVSLRVVLAPCGDGRFVCCCICLAAWEICPHKASIYMSIHTARDSELLYLFWFYVVQVERFFNFWHKAKRQGQSGITRRVGGADIRRMGRVEHHAAQRQQKHEDYMLSHVRLYASFSLKITGSWRTGKFMERAMKHISCAVWCRAMALAASDVAEMVM